MTQGIADPMKLYMSGDLKIGGDIMASQKLDFLKKIDPQLVFDAAKARGGSGGGSAPAAGGSDPVEDAFIAIDHYIGANKDAVTSIGKVYHHAQDDLQGWSVPPYRSTGDWKGRGYLTDEAIEARAQWNTLRPRLGLIQHLALRDSDLYLMDRETGETVLIAGDGEAESINEPADFDPEGGAVA